jgi:hypothetical protein
MLCLPASSAPANIWIVQCLFKKKKNYTRKLKTDRSVPRWLLDLFFLNRGLQAAEAHTFPPWMVLLRACKTRLN